MPAGAVNHPDLDLAKVGNVIVIVIIMFTGIAFQGHYVVLSSPVFAVV